MKLGNGGEDDKGEVPGERVVNGLSEKGHWRWESPGDIQGRTYPSRQKKQLGSCMGRSLVTS